MSRFIFAGFLAALLAMPASAETYYVSTTGSDKNDGSVNSEWGTISRSISRLNSGDTLIVRDGIYIGEDHFISDIPSGTTKNFTTVRAENPFGVRIVSKKRLGRKKHLVSVDGENIHAEGFIVDHIGSKYPPFSVVLRGNRSKITRMIIRREGGQNDYGGWLKVGGSYNLVEDVAGVGTARYGFNTGGPSSTANHIIFRRVVGRMDHHDTPQPKSTFVHYGSSQAASTHIVWQNVIAIDSNQPDYHGGGSGYKNGGIKANKTASNDIIAGSIVLGEQVENHAVSMAGHNNRIENTVIWDNHLGNYGSTDPIAYKLSSGFLGSPNNSYVSNLTTGQNGNSSADNMQPGDQQYLLMPDDYPANADGKAVILNRIGVSGTFHGDPGWDADTGEALWPWPYEDEIKAIFAEDNPTPEGYTPPNNVAARGFAANGNGLYGGKITLTSYIWEYLGNPCPTNRCNKAPVADNDDPLPIVAE